MKIALINGSPKGKNSNSAYLLRELKLLTEGQAVVLEFPVHMVPPQPEQLVAICDCDTLVFAFPLYVDGIPSNLLRFLEKLQAHLNAAKPKTMVVYAVVNCGFYEGRQNLLAMEMMQNWCRRAGLVWGQGLGTGAGEMLGAIQSVPMGRGPKRNFRKALGTLAWNILNGSGGDSIFISPNFPSFAFVLSAHAGWRKQARKNGLTRRDLYRK